MARLRVLSLKLCFSSILFLLFSLVLEGTTRLFWYEVNEDGMCSVLDPVYRHRNRANCEYTLKKAEGQQVVSYKMNDCGFRDPRPCGRYQTAGHLVFALGDSFTFGSMVPEPQTYVRVAEAALRARGASVDYINTGVGGWDLPQYSLALDEAISFHPEVVTIGLLPNDLFRDLSESAAGNRAAAAGAPEAASQSDGTSARQRPLAERLSRAVMNRSRALDLLAHLMLSQDALYAGIYQMRGEDSFLRKEYSGLWRGKIGDAERILGEMSKRASRHGIRLVLISIPQRIQALIVSQPHKFPTLDARMLSKQFSDVAGRLGIAHVDFMEYVADHPRPTSLYYPIDGHLTPEGQRALGRYLADRLNFGS